MILEGKTVNFLGDSITEGYGVSDMENCRYDNMIKNKCNLKAVYNFGISGTCIARQMAASENTRYDLYFCGRVQELNPDADITVVFGGTNDYGHGDAPFGKLTDKTPDSFCGAVDYLINAVKKLYPKTRLVFMTPARRCGDTLASSNPNKREDAKPLIEYVKVIKEKCAEYGVPVLDLYNNLGLNPNDEKSREAYTVDGLHFNDDGHRKIAECLIDFLQKL